MVSYSFEGHKRVWTARDEEENEKIFSEQSKPTGVKIPQDITPTYLTNGECDVEKWPLMQLVRLLRFYAAHRCLWDVEYKDYRKRKVRQAAFIDITAALDGGFTKAQVIQKINILRNTYRYEKKRIKQRLRRGLGASTKLKWFPLADAFLRNVSKKGRKKEDPSNSDCDLENDVVFFINPDYYMPLEQEISSENLEELKNDLVGFQSSMEIKEESFGENSQLHSAALCKEEKHCQFKFEQVKDSVKNKSWFFEDTLQFLQLLGNHSVLFETSAQSGAIHTLILESIAREMKRTCKSIEKRWLILQKVFKEEKPKILENPHYKPSYKWWPEAKKLLVMDSNIYSNMGDKDVATEFIFLPETENVQSSDCDEYENRFLENPIPSVAPLSNMDEAMTPLFHEANDYQNVSSFHKDSESESSSKFVWHGLADDLLEGKWSLKQSVKFLRLYGAHRCLWDLKDVDYRSRILRIAALEDIAASMGHGLTAAYVAKKIKIFRITYMQQRKRLLEATEKGEKPQILLKWFPLADSFLRPHIGLRSIKSDAKEIPQFDYQYVYANLNLIDPGFLNEFRGKGTQNVIEIGDDTELIDVVED